MPSSQFRFAFCLWAVVAAAPAHAQSSAPWTLHQALDVGDQWKVSGSIRARYEAIDNQARAGVKNAEDLVSFRSTLLAEYNAGRLRIGGEIFDSRAYGGDTGGAVSTNEVNTLEIAQAYVIVDLDKPGGDKYSANLQAGRMLLNVGSRRLVAADDYRNTTNTYTGLKAELRSQGGFSATLIYVLPNVRLPADQPSLLDNERRIDRESFDLTLWGGLVASPKIWNGVVAEVGYYGISERDRPDLATRNRRLHTISSRLIRDPAPVQFDFEIEGMYQFGTIRETLAVAAPKQDVAASFLHAEVGYQWKHLWQPRLAFEYDRASGDRPGGKFGRFDTLFGGRRPDLAPSGIYNAVGRVNISALGLRFEAVPISRWDFMTTYRALLLASRTDAFSTTNVRDAAGQSGSFAGHQLDARVRYWIVPRALRAEFDAVWLAKGRFLHRAPNAPRGGDTAYVSMNLLATF